MNKRTVRSAGVLAGALVAWLVWRWWVDRRMVATLCSGLSGIQWDRKDFERSWRLSLPEKRSMATRRLWWALAYPGEPVPPLRMVVEIVNVNEDAPAEPPGEK